MMPARMPWHRRRVAAEAGALLALTRLVLPALPFAWVRGALDVYARLLSRRRADQGGLELVRWAMAGVGRRSPRSSCLPEALAGWALLRRRGLPATLHVGVRRPDRTRTIDAHAWVECQGGVVVGQVEDLTDYVPLVSGRERLTEGIARLLRGTPGRWSEIATSPAALVEHCAEEDLTGLVYQALVAQPNDWPPHLASELAAAARAQVSTELVRTRETTRVLDTLAAASVPALVFKGTALAHSVYQQPSLRPRNDTDLLIRERDRTAAARTLEALGYVTTNLSGSDVLFCQFEVQREDEFGVTHAFDVHWALSTQPLFANLLDFDHLEASAAPVPALGAHARAFGPTDALLLTCVHPAMHHRNEERLVWLYDIHLLSAALSGADWDRLANLAIRKSVAAVCLDALVRAGKRLGTAVPAGVRERLGQAATSHEPTARYLDPARRWGDELASSMGALGWRGRLRLLREVAFPAPGYMLAAYGVSSARFRVALLPALYAHRGVRGVWKVLIGRK